MKLTAPGGGEVFAGPNVLLPQDKARYVGEAKTHLQAVLTATAVNLIRLVRWRQGAPLSRTRRTAFQDL